MAPQVDRLDELSEQLVLVSGALRMKRVSVRCDTKLEMTFAGWFQEIQDASGDPEPFTLLSQVPVSVGNSSYRLDFQVVAHIGFESLPLRLAVEVDGHAFHERTKQQVQKRDSRDRDLQLAGWRMLHFSYSEFVDRPVDCVFAVLGAADQMRKMLLIGEADVVL